MTFESPKADRVTAAVFFLLGLAMLWGGIEMDRLEIRRIHPASIPGLVPMFLGAILMVCSIFLAMSKPAVKATAENGESADSGNWGDFAFAAAWSCFFSLIMVGNMPFVVASAIYIALFSTWFFWPQKPTSAKRLKMIVLVAVFAIAAAAGISTLFEYGFLVRLP